METAFYIIAALCFALIIMFLYIAGKNRLLRRDLDFALAANEENKKVHALYMNAHQQAAATAEQFIDSCKLIDINRNGRVNVFTFARGDDFFAIECMGLLSDDVDGWRQQAGLIEDQPTVLEFGKKPK